MNRKPGSRSRSQAEGPPKGSGLLPQAPVTWEAPVGTGWVDGRGRVHVLSGYRKDYQFDDRFSEDAPPYFLSTGEYQRISWTEISEEEFLQ